MKDEENLFMTTLYYYFGSEYKNCSCKERVRIAVPSFGKEGAHECALLEKQVVCFFLGLETWQYLLYFFRKCLEQCYSNYAPRHTSVFWAIP
jgi:hypothetical protein